MLFTQLELTPLLAGGSFTTLIVLALAVLAFMFIIQRPMKKQQAAQRQMQDELQPGARVMLTSGLFGTVSHLGDKQAVVELAPGTEVTVVRQAISKVLGPDDEEFEYEDNTSAAPQPEVNEYPVTETTSGEAPSGEAPSSQTAATPTTADQTTAAEPAVADSSATDYPVTGSVLSEPNDSEQGAAVLG